ncbi:UNVERIFIED_CONTAM: hypothetical protein Sradi_4878600 [Sesamum radiatum]|uniref:Uncharacterized protein n=1 Tax=Sesamum radiatum TaxID=300843 RepID=A0AAW2MZE4_SESRA
MLNTGDAFTLLIRSRKHIPNRSIALAKDFYSLNHLKPPLAISKIQSSYARNCHDSSSQRTNSRTIGTGNPSHTDKALRGFQMTILASHFSQLTTWPTNPLKLHRRPTSPADETRLQYLVQVSIGSSMPNLEVLDLEHSRPTLRSWFHSCQTYAQPNSTVSDKHIIYAAAKAFFGTKLTKGSSVQSHGVKMLSLVEKHEDLKTGLDNDTYIDVILQSLPPSYDPFVINYNMNRLEKAVDIDRRGFDLQSEWQEDLMLEEEEGKGEGCRGHYTRSRRPCCPYGMSKGKGEVLSGLR